MGNWHMSIQGIGSHHNPSYDRDADKLMRKFVDELRAAGHTVDYATFTFGGRQDLHKPGDEK